MSRIELGPSLLLMLLGGLGFGLGYLMYETKTEDQIIARASDNELQERLDLYRMHIRSGGQTGCRMNVEDYGTYHAIRREIEHRTVTDGTEAETNE